MIGLLPFVYLYRQPKSAELESLMFCIVGKGAY